MHSQHFCRKDSTVNSVPIARTLLAQAAGQMALGQPGTGFCSKLVSTAQKLRWVVGAGVHTAGTRQNGFSVTFSLAKCSRQTNAMGTLRLLSIWLGSLVDSLSSTSCRVWRQTVLPQPAAASLPSAGAPALERSAVASSPGLAAVDSCGGDRRKTRVKF